MSAPRTEPLALALLLLLPACASSPPEPATAAAPAPMGAEASLDQLAAPSAAAPIEELAELETSLAAYEAQLAHNEDRLRAMGVRIAAVAPRAARGDGADDRFAQPPPPRLGDPDRERTVEEKAVRDKPAKKDASRPTTKSAQTAPPSPTPRPVQPDSPGSDTRRDAGNAAGMTRPKEAEAEPTAGTSKRKAAKTEAEGGRCVDLCDLASATCELESKICDLASRHTDEPRYAEVCLRAEDDCRLASEACTRCSP
jgi:hypothetical protein